MEIDTTPIDQDDAATHHATERVAETDHTFQVYKLEKGGSLSI